MRHNVAINRCCLPCQTRLTWLTTAIKHLKVWTYSTAALPELNSVLMRICINYVSYDLSYSVSLCAWKFQIEDYHD